MAETDLVDYEEELATEQAVAPEVKKGSYVGIHATSFRDLFLKPEILNAIADCGFEHPSEVQQQCIPQAIMGVDVLSQAKSGMGKTAVFVIASLQQLVIDESKERLPSVIVLCHTRELAYQIKHEFDRFQKYMPHIKTVVFFGGQPKTKNIETLKNEHPDIVVGTPGRILDLIRTNDLKMSNIKHFVLDECDNMLEKVDMRQDVQEIFISAPRNKQVMMFSATLSKEVREICKKFMHNPLEVLIDDEEKLTLHGLLQHYVKLTESQKNKKLVDLLDELDFNQVVIFVKSVTRSRELNKLLVENNFPSVCIHSKLPQEERMKIYDAFKAFQSRILVSTDLFERGLDFDRVNIVINYDMPTTSDSYLHRVGRAGRFGTKGLAITFSTAEDEKVLAEVQERFSVKITELPSEPIDKSAYMS